MTALKYTHYSYMCVPNGYREPTGLFDLAATGITTRRNMIHAMLKNGELLCKLPFDGICDMVTLRAALEHEHKVKNNER